MSLVCEVEHFSGSFGVHGPFAFNVPPFLKCPQQRIHCTGSEVDSKIPADFTHYLVAVHGLLVEVLEDDHVEESFGEFVLDFFLVVIGHFFCLLLVLLCCTAIQYVVLRHISHVFTLRKRQYKSSDIP